MPINDLTTTCSLLENSKALNVIFTGHPGGLEMKALTINCIIPDLCPVRGPMSHVLSHLSTIDSLIKAKFTPHPPHWWVIVVYNVN